MSFEDDMDDGPSRKKYVVLGAVGIAIAAAAIMFSGILSTDDANVEGPDVIEDGQAVLTDLDEVVEEIMLPDEPEPETVQKETEDIAAPIVVEESVIKDAKDGDVQSLTDLAVDLLVDTREEFGLTEEDEPDESGLTMEDILGTAEPDPEDVTQPGADILERVEEFKKIPSEPVPTGATSGTVTWVVAGNVININEVMIHLTGVKSGGVSDRDALMGECPRDTLALYVLTGRTDPDGNSYGKVWCYGYPPTKPDTTVNNILKAR